MKLTPWLASLCALAATLRAEPYVAAAGGPAWMTWFSFPRTKFTRVEATIGWRFSPHIALEASLSTGGVAHSSYRYASQTAALFGPGTLDLNSVYLADVQQSRKSTATTVGPGFSLPLGRQFSLVSRQQAAFVQNTRFTDERGSWGYAYQLPNLPNRSRHRTRETFHHVRWQPTAGVKWKPAATSPCEFSLEAMHLDAAEVRILATLVRASVRF